MERRINVRPIPKLTIVAALIPSLYRRHQEWLLYVVLNAGANDDLLQGKARRDALCDHQQAAT